MPLVALVFFVSSVPSVVRAVVVSPDEIQSVVSAYVRERLPPGVEKFALDFRRGPEPVEVPSTSARCEIAGRPRVLWNGVFGITVQVVGARGEVRTELLSLKVTGDAFPLRLVRAIEAGSPVLPADVTGTARALAQISEQSVFSTEELAGRTAAHKIAAGTILLRSHLVSPVLVRAGEGVRLLAIRGALVVETHGIALSAGRLGDSVKVRNTATKMVVEGRVRGERMVEAEGEAPRE